MNKHWQYGLNPPKGKATHYNNVAEMYVEYMQHNSDWFYHNGLQWCYMPSEPPIKTLIGHPEALRVWFPVERAKVKDWRNYDYYSRFD